ncbi:MAG: hypothetical protein K9K87_15330 [Desulfotignum sp.]|nr:hypothetical protein [Desulfotignum sp.]
MSPLLPPKPHKSYSELVSLLISRGMIVPDKNRAERKLSQIGYYRLSGFWYPCREFRTISRQADRGIKKKPQREDFFQPNINFNDIIDRKSRIQAATKPGGMHHTPFLTLNGHSFLGCY